MNKELILRLSLVTNVVLLAACVALAACANTSGFAAAAVEIAKDPKCGHTDRLDIDLGLTGSHGKVFLERTCPTPQTGAPQPTAAPATPPA